MTNLFNTHTDHPELENFETLLQTKDIHIEKIISHGQTSQTWYVQDHDEWVVLIEGEGTLLFESGEEIPLKKGEHIYIPKQKKHKVTYCTSPTVWLAVHFSTH